MDTQVWPTAQPEGTSPGGVAQLPVPIAVPASVPWPVRTGLVPPLADRFSTRPETAPDLAVAFGRNAAIALTSRSPGDGSVRDWLRCTGKTQLAAYYAETQWRARLLDLLIWINASSPASALSGYVEAAMAVTGSQSAGSAEEITASLLSWLRQTDRRWLVVLDDVADGTRLAALWPSGAAGQVLITAASSQSLAGLPERVELDVRPFSRREAMSYLVGRLSSDPDQRRGAIGLLEDLDCQPVALTQATAVVGSSWMTCEDYRERFARRAALLTEPGRGRLPAAAVCWTLSVDHTDQLMRGGSAQACLAVASLLDAHGVPATVFTTSAVCSYLAGESAGPVSAQAIERSRTTLHALEQAGLIDVDRSSDPNTVRMNAALQRAVHAAMPADMLNRAGTVAAAALLELWPTAERSRWQARSLRSSAVSLHQATGDLLWTGGVHPLLLRAGQSLDQARLTGPAVEYWADLAAASDRVLGPGHPDSLALMERLAAAYVTAGRAAEAVAWYQRIMADWAQTFGTDHPRTIAARVMLGRVLVTAGLLDDAIGVLSAAVRDSDRARGNDDQQSLAGRQELAGAYLAGGRLDDAIKLYRRTLADRERTLGQNHPDTLASRQQLAEAYLADSRMRDAFSQYKRVVTDRERTQGADHPDTLRARGSLATAYHKAGRMAAAVQLFEQVYAGSARSLGPDDPDTLAAAVALAGAYYSVGRLSDSAALFREAVARGERVLAPGDPLVRSARESLAAFAGE